MTHLDSGLHKLSIFTKLKNTRIYCLLGCEISRRISYILIYFIFYKSINLHLNISLPKYSRLLTGTNRLASILIDVFLIYVTISRD
jgi:hypothetical protein